VPLRFLLLRWLDRKFGLFAYSTSLELGSVEMAHYGHCLLHTAQVARKLGYTRISAIEFGVAGGNGLVTLENHADRVRQATGIDVQVYGFDTGIGMPPPQDVRDMPYLWQSGDFTMDQAKLRARLRSAKLQIGRVEETVARFCAEQDPPPIGFISFDLDYYSATTAALGIFNAGHKYFLPRVTCYFDDLSGGIAEAFSQFAGELLAIDEFNAAHTDIKIARARGLRFSTHQIPRLWHEHVYIAHRFGHDLYTRPIGQATSLALNES